MGKRSPGRDAHRASSPRRGAVPPAAALPRAPARDLVRGVAELLVWALVLVPPLVVVRNAKEAFRLPKLLVSGWLALASLLPLCWALARRGAVSWREVWELPALRAVAPALLVATLGLATTRHPLQVREALVDLWIAAACLVGWSAGLSARRLARPLGGLLVPGATLALFGILQFHDLYRPFQFAEVREGARLGITSLAGNPGDLAAFLVLPCLLAPWWMARARTRTARWAGAAALLLCLYAVAVSQTLAALAALVAAALVYGAVILPRRRSIALVAAGALAAAVLVAAVPPLRVRLMEKARQVATGDWNEVLTGRLDGWQAAVWMASRHPWSGVGHGAFAAEFIPAKRELLARGASFYPRQLQVVFANAHNEYLEVAATWGMPGLAALVWGMAVVVVTARRIGAGHDRAVAWAGLAALAVLALAHFPARTAIVGYPAVLFLAWVLRRGRPEEPAQPVHDTAGRAAARGIPAAALAALLGLALVAALVFQTDRLRDRLLASRLLRQVESLTVIAVNTGNLSPRLLAANLEALRRAAALDPAEVGIPLARGGQYYLLGRSEAALAAYREALALEPRPEIYLNLSRAYAQAGQREEADRLFAVVRQLDPHLARRALTGR